MDNSPQVRWSNAWWELVFLGIAVPIALLILLTIGLLRNEAYTVGMMRSRVEFHTVFGFQAQLLWVAYGAGAIAAFAQGYARNHQILARYYEPVLALSLICTAASLIWSSAMFFT